MNSFNEMVSNFKNEIDKNKRSKQIISDQHSIMEDLSGLVFSESFENKISSIDDQIEDIDNKIKYSSEFLAFLQKSKESRVSLILKELISKYQADILRICTDTIGKNWGSVLFTEIIELEDRILDDTNVLIEKGQYIEKEEEKYSRINSIMEHKVSMMPFLGESITES